MDQNKVNVETAFSYRSIKYGTRRNPFIWTTQKMELDETLLYGFTKNGTRRNPFILVHKKWN
jgi:hypothetical protein